MEAIADRAAQGNAARDIIAQRDLAVLGVTYIGVMLVATREIKLKSLGKVGRDIEIARCDITAVIACIAGIGACQRIGTVTEE